MVFLGPGSKVGVPDAGISLLDLSHGGRWYGFSPQSSKKGKRVMFPSGFQSSLKEKFGLFVDFEFLTEMGSWGTD